MHQRRGAVLHQHRRDKLGLEHGSQIRALPEFPAHDQMRFIGRAFLGIHRIGVGGLPGRAEGGLQANCDLAAQPLKPM